MTRHAVLINEFRGDVKFAVKPCEGFVIKLAVGKGVGIGERGECLPLKRAWPSKIRVSPSLNMTFMRCGANVSNPVIFNTGKGFSA